MDGDGIQTLESILTIIAWAGAALSFVVVFHRRIRAFTRAVMRAIRLSDGLHHHFGEDDPAEEIARAIKDLRRADGEYGVRQRILAAHLKLAIYVCDPTGRCTYGSESLAELFGCDQSELIGTGWLKYVAEEQRQEVWDTWLYSVKHGTPYTAHYQLAHEVPSQRKWIETQAYAVTVDDVVICYVGYAKEYEFKHGTE